MTCGCQHRRSARPILSQTIDATPRKLAVPEGRLTFRVDVDAAAGGATLSIDGGQTSVPLCAESPLTLDVPSRVEVIITAAASGVVAVLTEP